MNFEAHYSITYIDKYNFKLEHCLSVLIGMFVIVTVLISGVRQGLIPSHTVTDCFGGISLILKCLGANKNTSSMYLGKTVIYFIR